MFAFLLVFVVEKFSSQCLVAFASIIIFFIFMIIKNWIFLYPSHHLQTMYNSFTHVFVFYHLSIFSMYMSDKATVKGPQSTFVYLFAEL